jgi:two-component system response regulator MprA
MAGDSYVLVVDDDPAIRGLLSDALRDEGFLVDLAAHGREALEAMRARRPSTVVLDLMMPVMDGFTFMQACHLEQLCDDVPIVVISAVHEAIQRLHEVPVHACLAKPFDLDELIRTVGRFARPNGHVRYGAISRIERLPRESSFGSSPGSIT